MTFGRTGQNLNQWNNHIKFEKSSSVSTKALHFSHHSCLPPISTLSSSIFILQRGLQRDQAPPMATMTARSLFLFLTAIYVSSTSATINRVFFNCLSSRMPYSDLSSILFISTKPSSYNKLLDSRIQNLRFQVTSTPKPNLIVMPTAVPHIQAAVVCAKNASIQIKIRSGGHDYEGISYTSVEDEFLLLDMQKFNNITIDTERETAYVQAGATLGQLYYRIAEKNSGYGFPAGVCPTVGVGGHISGGGYGNMLRKYGLTVDNVVGAEIVVANGSFFDRKSMGADLFWAMLGGGGASFGVVVSYTVRMLPVPPTVTVFRVAKTLEEGATNIVSRWQDVAHTVDNDLFMRLLLQPVTINKNGTIRATVMALYLGQSGDLMKLMNQYFPELGLQESNCTEMSWIQSVAYWATNNITALPESLLNTSRAGVNFLKRKSDYVEKPMSKEDLEGLWKKMLEVGKVGLVMNPYGGRMNEIDAEDTPFPHRSGNLWKMQYSVNWENESDTEMYLQQARDLYKYTEPLVSRNPRRAYLNYRDLEIGVAGKKSGSYDADAAYGRKQFAGNFERLVGVKTAVDPDNFFRHEQSIPTSYSEK